MVERTERELAPLSEKHIAEVRARRRKAFLASSLAVKRGILGKTLPVLDVGCRNPYVGVLYSLQKDLNWNGHYWGIDATLPERAIERWKEKSAKKPEHRRNVKLMTRPIDLEQGMHLPFPPTKNDGRKYLSTAILVDTLGKVQNRENLLAECKRVAAQVIVVGGATDDELGKWDFQIVRGYTTESDLMLWAGVWLDLKAEALRRRKDLVPESGMGWFGVKDKRGQGMFPAVVGFCQKCGIPDGSGKSHFGCAHCGTENRVRRMA